MKKRLVWIGLDINKDDDKFLLRLDFCYLLGEGVWLLKIYIKVGFDDFCNVRILIERYKERKV